MHEIKSLTARRVMAGVELLDRDSYYGPDWDLAVDLDKLTMHSCIRCVLGQLFFDFDSGMRMLGLEWGGVVAKGFDRDIRSCGTAQLDYAMLDRLWTYVIKARRAARNEEN